MLQLSHYQTLFDLNVTSERCKLVLEQVEATVKPLVESYLRRLNDPSLHIHTYATTLQTTYHDALKKKHSNIGRKYFVQIMRTVGQSQVNELTLEFNGMSRVVSIHVETNFYPMWEASRTNRLGDILGGLGADTTVMASSSGQDAPEREIVKFDAVQDFIKSCIKPRRRPWFYFAKLHPLKEEWSESRLFEELDKAYAQLSSIRSYLADEKGLSDRAGRILELFKEEHEKQEILLFQKPYQLQLSAAEKVQSGVSRQAFTVKDGDQLIEKGYVVYYRYHEKQTPHEVLAIQLDGHNHIYTNIRNLLGPGLQEWWIRKTFATHSLDNAKVLEESMTLLRQHGIEVRDADTYLAGVFDNDAAAFTEPAAEVKKRLIASALLFAHASEKLQLPTSEEGGSQPPKPAGAGDGGDEGGDPETYTASFRLPPILDTVVSSGLTFSLDIVRDFHLNLTALDDKHFVILSGISGTGKTQLARLYANAVYGLEYEAANPYLSIIPVRPDWTDSSALFGYYSSFEQRYVVPEFLRVVLQAQQEREKPHFIVLDEMNLARVEYYLSDYLSGVESRKEIPLHSREDVEAVPKTVTIPPNLYVIGTVNVDETTHAISDKVLDRAFVMTLSEVDFDSFWDRIDEETQGRVAGEFHFLRKVYGIMKEHHLHFGYRSMQEMLRKLLQNKALEDSVRLDEEKALERVVMEKVLPKVRGDDSIADMLSALKGTLAERFGAGSESVRIVERMEKEIVRYGAAQFWR
ncbi:McrB family protein [Paenibacillus antri]|nr:AAA family ATPase [Paenibacillus antri]